MAHRRHNGIEERNELVHEFAPVGRYRIRLLRDNDDAKLYLDVREYLVGGNFEGFSRRGIRLVDVKEIEALQSDLLYVIDRWEKEVGGPKPSAPPFRKGDEVELVSMPHSAYAVQPGTKGAVKDCQRLPHGPWNVYVYWEGKKFTDSVSPDAIRKIGGTP